MATGSVGSLGPVSEEFGHDGYRIRYDSYGSGDRVIILAHGLLMNRGMFSRLGPALAERGQRAICVDLLGHGRSDRPEDLRLYSMPRFARQVSKLIDHLGIDSAVVGGTSLGANVALELATREPEKVRGLFIEMPVLDNALTGVAAFFTPIMLGLRFGRPAFEVTSRVTGLVPRTHHLVDMGLDLLRQRPGPSLSVLEGLLLGETAPHREERKRISQPTLIVGHTRDPVHPFSDSGMLAEELENATLVEANSILEWRLTPSRLDDELAAFLDRVWETKKSNGRPVAAGRKKK
jgi:pimeloyl-ACP methyl ester carboxylesterase